jgi:hypothetical protein
VSRLCQCLRIIPQLLSGRRCSLKSKFQKRTTQVDVGQQIPRLDGCVGAPLSRQVSRPRLRDIFPFRPAECQNTLISQTSRWSRVAGARLMLYSPMNETIGAETPQTKSIMPIAGWETQRRAGSNLTSLVSSTSAQRRRTVQHPGCWTAGIY